MKLELKLGETDSHTPEVLSRIRKNLGTELVLLGSSLGGFTAATWAVSRPGRVRALVLLAPAFDLGPRWAARMGAAEVERWRLEGRIAFDHYAWGRKEELSYEFLADARRYDSFPLPRCPTLVIQGTQDDVCAP